MSQVKLILRDGVPGLGEAGDLVQVKPGFARNYLIPQGKAIFASEARIRELEHHKRIVAEHVAKELKSLQAVKAKVESLKLEVKVRVGEEGKLFGSVTSANVHELLTAEGVEVDRRRIELKEPIKEAGEHTVPVKLHRDVVAQLQVHVVPEE
jgi:large subunit ribosomal protein L9